VSEPGLRDWKSATPVDAEQWLEHARVPWWIAGGWALDLHTGQPGRTHGDLDVGCFRDDLPSVRAALGQWLVYAAHDGRLTQLAPSESPGPQVHSLWCRPEGAGEWWLELMLDEREGSDWVFRRAPDVRLPIHDIVLRDANDMPYLRPEVQLLYKARNVRPRDEVDFLTVLPRLDEGARRWLRHALSRSEPGHPWLDPLRSRA
jgi:hypothetical protein